MNLEDPRKPIDGYTVGELFGGSPSKSGKSVNADNALTVSAAWRAIQVLGGAVSSIPWKPYKKTAEGRERLKNHPTVNIFTNRVNDKYTTPVWMDRVMNHLCLRGNHYALPIRNGMGQVIELELLNPDDVTVYETRQTVVYKIKGSERIYSSSEIIHVPHLGSGVVGMSTISYAKDDFGNEMARKDYAGEVWNEGGKPQALLTPTQTLTPTQRREATEAWLEAKRHAHDIIMPAGFSHTSMGFKPEEMQVLQSGQHSIADVARWFGTPRHKLFDPEGSAYNSNEHAAIEFLSDTIAPIIVKIEYEYSSKIYQLESERNYHVESDMNAYIRPDTTTRFEAYAKGIHAAVMTPKEARDRENLRNIEGSDELYINSGSVPIRLMDQLALQKSQPKAEPVKGQRNGYEYTLVNGQNHE